MTNTRENHYKAGWNDCLDKLKDKLSLHMNAASDGSLYSRQVVDWKRIERVIDEMKKDE